MKKKWIVAIVFLVVGFQLILFAHRAAMLVLAANVDQPDTIYVLNRDTIASILEERQIDSLYTVRVSSNHTEAARDAVKKRRYECFRFNPNTVTKDELERLGFTSSQAQAIINYRAKGGKFKKLVQFQASPTVSDSLYQRLKNYIYLPKIDINKADTAELQYLPGIGSGRANRIVQFRSRLRGFSYPEQLLDIPSIDYDVYEDLKDRIICSPNEPFPLWSASEDSLFLHPYIKYAADKIIKYKKHHDKSKWQLESLIMGGIIKEPYAYKLRKCNISPP